PARVRVMRDGLSAELDHSGHPRCSERLPEIVQLGALESRRMNDGIDAPKNQHREPSAPPDVGSTSIVDGEARAEPRARRQAATGTKARRYRPPSTTTVREA